MMIVMIIDWCEHAFLSLIWKTAMFIYDDDVYIYSSVVDVDMNNSRVVVNNLCYAGKI